MTSRRVWGAGKLQHVGALLWLFAASLLLPGCAGQPLAPTPTAVPLVATATPRTAATRPEAMATATAPGPEATAAAQTQEVIGPDPTQDGVDAAAYSTADEALARSTVEDLLARLVRGEAESVARLYLTEKARAAGLDVLLIDLAGGEAPITQATLLRLEPEPPSSYRAEAALLREEDVAEAPQSVTFHLVYQRGLWQVDDASWDEVSPGEASSSTPPAGAGGTAQPAATPAPTRTQPAGSSARGGRATSPLVGRIAFQASSGGHIYVVNADGSGLQRIADGLDPAWSPAGDRIAFTRWRSPWGVYLIRPDGSDEERVVDGNQFKEVAWAPGGRRLAFTLNQGSSGPQEVCFLGYCFTIPAYSLGQIWVADLDSRDLESLPVDDQAVHAPTWDPAGGRIVYAGERGLSWIDLDTEETGRFANSSAWDGSPAYSPNGQRIAFMGRAHDRWEIFVMNADGSGRRQLTQSSRDARAPGMDEPPHNVAPAWSPDGKQIAFLSNRDGRWRIYVMNADGTDQRPLFAGAADGVRIVYDWASERVISWGPAP
ncbi:MAG: PD40 domain-containing protein [Anaerolineae bacterium]|nr:PD40 domain-containing protein [Anaerolineae bacterium]